jgi:hypothetical protein
VDSAAGGLTGSNLTILNGAEGINQVLAGLVAQGLSILDTLKKTTPAPAETNGSTPLVPAEQA